MWFDTCARIRAHVSVHSCVCRAWGEEAGSWSCPKRLFCSEVVASSFQTRSGNVHTPAWGRSGLLPAVTQQNLNPSGPTSSSVTWACSCSTMSWCWLGGPSVTGLLPWPAAAHTHSCPRRPSGAWRCERSHTRAVSSDADHALRLQTAEHADRFVSVCRCEPRLRPGRSGALVGLCHGARTGQGLLPVCADVHHSLSSRLTPGQGGHNSNGTRRLGATVSHMTCRRLTLWCEKFTPLCGINKLDGTACWFYGYTKTRQLNQQMKCSWNMGFRSDFCPYVQTLAPQINIIFAILFTLSGFLSQSSPRCVLVPPKSTCRRLAWTWDS